jgi:hypothetical protein
MTGNPTQNSIIGCGKPAAGQFACITPADLTQFGLTVANTGPLPPGTVLFAGQNDYKSPMSQQVSLGIEREIGAGFSISANYIYVHTTHLPWPSTQTRCPGRCLLTAGPRPAVNRESARTGCPRMISLSELGSARLRGYPAPGFADPTHTILQNNACSAGERAYQGGILSSRFANHLPMANYTYSSA